jgi:hypothetical protein
MLDRAENQVARIAVDDLLTEERTEPSLDDVGVLVFAAVPVVRRR